MEFYIMSENEDDYSGMLYFSLPINDVLIPGETVG